MKTILFLLFFLFTTSLISQTNLTNYPDSSYLGKEIKIILESYNLVIGQVSKIQEPSMILEEFVLN